jgi:outer membrane protein assembly factor BamD
MTTPFRSSLGHLACLAVIAVLAAGCSSNKDRSDRPENPFKTATEGPGGTKAPLSDRELRKQANELYLHAREALDNADYSVAITRYDTLIARYPFSDYSTQAELEKIYAQYKSYQADEAVTAADRFLRAHPRHPHADYVQYLKGVTDFERDGGVLETITPGSAKRDVGNQRRAFEDFALLLQRYPNSRYAGDARRRMMYSRNRIADHELSVAQFYVTRGAYVAAAKRATDIITEYPGAPATAEALKILQRSYAKIGMEQEAKDTASLIAMNSDTVHYTDAPKPGLIVAPVAPAAAPAEASAPAEAGATAPEQSHGLMSRFTHLFEVFDSSKPENQHTYVIGNGDAGNSGNVAPGAASGNAAGAAPTSSKNSGVSIEYVGPSDSADSTAAGAKTTTAAPAATAPAASSASPAPAAPAPAAPSKNNGSGGLSVQYVGPSDNSDGAAANAASAGKTTAQAQPAAAPAPAQPEEKKGFFTWFAGLFSFLDPDKREAAPDSPAPADGKPAASGSTTTK